MVSVFGQKARRTVVWPAALAVLTIVSFLPVLRNGFLGLDDPDYVTNNPQVLAGLTLEGFRWAFSTYSAANWHPLTWLSHMLDIQLFGLDPQSHHAMSLGLHVAAVLALFGALRAMTGATLRSCAVAALFAVHPLRVESVAWVAERKDVLCTLFSLLSLGAYARYVRQPRLHTGLTVVMLFALALLAKPMAVTLPFVLLLLDYWPLGRLGPDSSAAGRWAVALEKVPLAALAVSSCIITLAAQHAGGMISSLTHWPFWVRLANAPLAYAGYLRRTVWPLELAIPYPHPGRGVSWLAVAGSVALLAALTWLAVAARRSRPILATGWLWYLGTLIPVIGLVQVGGQGLADRYTYLPQIGLLLVAVWVIGDKAATSPPFRALARVAAPAAVLALMAGTWAQTQYWSDDVTLFGRGVAIDPDNYMARTNLAGGLANAGRWSEAIPHSLAAIRARPDYAGAYYNLGIALVALDKPESALANFQQVLRIAPDDPAAHLNVGALLAARGQVEQAMVHYTAALAKAPDYAEALFNMGTSLEQSGREEEAKHYFEKALLLKPDLAARKEPRRRP